jgi:thiol-disulfide isomerase/thioredoxin
MIRKLFLTALFCIFIVSESQSSEPIKIKVTFSDELADESQWVYWISSIGNEYNILDSLFVEKGRKEFTFNKEIPDSDDKWMTCKLIFPKKFPYEVDFFPASGESIQINIDSKSPWIVKAEGSPGSMEVYDLIIEGVKKTGLVIRSLKDSINNTTDETVRKQMEDSIICIERYSENGYWLDAIKTAKTPVAVLSAFLMLQHVLSSEKTDSLYTELKHRFPDSKMVQNYFTPSLPETPQSKEAYIRVKQLLRPFASENQNNSVSMDEELKAELSAISPYKIGDIVDGISLKGLNGNWISIKDIKMPYILIDFWAAWCGPCRGEIPNIKSTLENYNTLFSVYAISLDNNENSWKNAIKIDESDVFVHVYAGFGEKNGKIIAKRFGIEAIPANFLIDKDYRIIAANLHGDALRNKLAELSPN